MSICDADKQMIGDLARELSERFSSVSIVVTDFDPRTGKTESITRGWGDWFARRGAIAAYMESIQEPSTGLLAAIVDDDEDDA